MAEGADRLLALTQQVKDLSSTVDRLQGLNDSLQEENEILQSQVDEFELKLENLELDNELLRAEAEEAQQSLGDAQASGNGSGDDALSKMTMAKSLEIQRLNEQLQAITVERDELAKIAEDSARVPELEEQLSGMQSQLEDLKLNSAAAGDAEGIVATLTEKNMDLQDSVDALQSRVDELEELLDLSKELEESFEEREKQTKAELLALEDNVMSLKKDLVQSRAEAAAQSAAMEELRQQISVAVNPDDLHAAQAQSKEDLAKAQAASEAVISSLRTRSATLQQDLSASKLSIMNTLCESATGAAMLTIVRQGQQDVASASPTELVTSAVIAVEAISFALSELLACWAVQPGQPADAILVSGLAESLVAGRRARACLRADSGSNMNSTEKWLLDNQQKLVHLSEDAVACVQSASLADVQLKAKPICDSFINVCVDLNPEGEGDNNSQATQEWSACAVLSKVELVCWSCVCIAEEESDRMLAASLAQQCGWSSSQAPGTICGGEGAVTDALNELQQSMELQMGDTENRNELSTIGINDALVKLRVALKASQFFVEDGQSQVSTYWLQTALDTSLRSGVAHSVLREASSNVTLGEKPSDCSATSEPLMSELKRWQSQAQQLQQELSSKDSKILVQEGRIAQLSDAESSLASDLAEYKAKVRSLTLDLEEKKKEFDQELETLQDEVLDSEDKIKRLKRKLKEQSSAASSNPSSSTTGAAVAAAGSSAALAVAANGLRSAAFEQAVMSLPHYAMRSSGPARKMQAATSASAQIRFAQAKVGLCIDATRGGKLICQGKETLDLVKKHAAKALNARDICC